MTHKALGLRSMPHISDERARHLLSYNPETGFIIWKNPASRKMKAGDRAGAVMTNGYIILSLDGQKYLGHRIAWLIHYGSVPQFLDHINGIRDDNRILNLRPSSKTENSRNLSKPSHGLTSVFKGVNFERSRGNWKAQICVDKRRIQLGRFKTEEQAAAAYDWRAFIEFGEFAKTNGQVVML